jgi:hypothetical protein
MPRFDWLAPQRLAAPVTVYVRQFSGHPLERDAANLYGPPDGFVGTDGVFRASRDSPADVPVFEVTLSPEDGLYLLPYMARQADGSAWDDDTVHPGAPEHLARQPFFPDGSRLFEEIDRFGLDDSGVGNPLASKAEFDFYRVAPSGGYKQGLPESARTDAGVGDIAPEVMGRDFFNYRPTHLRHDPARVVMARIANAVQSIMDAGRYAGAMWLEGSPHIEDTLMWLNLLIDTEVPICGTSSQRPHRSVGGDGDRNIIDTVHWILSGAWKGSDGRNAAGVVAVIDQLIYTARELQKGDARPGGYLVTGGQGGIVGRVGPNPRGPILTFVPNRRHTYSSAVNLRRLPHSVEGVARRGDELVRVPVTVRDADGQLVGDALPDVRFVKSARYLPADDEATYEDEVEIKARIQHNLTHEPLSGFVAEGTTPTGNLVIVIDEALRRATFRGMPVVRVGRGSTGGFVSTVGDGLFIAGSNLTASKARIVLMASLLKLGSLPTPRDPDAPTEHEIELIRAKVRAYQEIFDHH